MSDAMKKLIEAAKEAVELMDDAADGNYKCDSFTSQPLKNAIKSLSTSPSEGEDDECYMYSKTLGCRAENFGGKCVCANPPQPSAAVTKEEHFKNWCDEKLSSFAPRAPLWIGQDLRDIHDAAWEAVLRSRAEGDELQDLLKEMKDAEDELRRHAKLWDEESEGSRAGQAFRAAEHVNKALSRFKAGRS